MNADIQDYIKKYCSEIQNLFDELRELIILSVPNEIEERLWAKLPSYYIGKKFIRIIPFKDHMPFGVILNCCNWCLCYFEAICVYIGDYYKKNDD